jgi:hypothetical protein
MLHVFDDDFADEGRALGQQDGLAKLKKVIGCLSRGQGKVTALEGVGEDQPPEFDPSGIGGGEGRIDSDGLGSNFGGA